MLVQARYASTRVPPTIGARIGKQTRERERERAAAGEERTVVRRSNNRMHACAVLGKRGRERHAQTRQSPISREFWFQCLTDDEERERDISRARISLSLADSRRRGPALPLPDSTVVSMETADPLWTRDSLLTLPFSLPAPFSLSLSFSCSGDPFVSS